MIVNQPTEIRKWHQGSRSAEHRINYELLGIVISQRVEWARLGLLDDIKFPTFKHTAFPTSKV